MSKAAAAEETAKEAGCSRHRRREGAGCGGDGGGDVALRTNGVLPRAFLELPPPAQILTLTLTLTLPQVLPPAFFELPRRRVT